MVENACLEKSRGKMGLYQSYNYPLNFSLFDKIACIAKLELFSMDTKYFSIFFSARNGCRILQSLLPEDRAIAINKLADLLVSKQSEILNANSADLTEARQNGLAKPLLSRLSLTPAKLNSLSTGEC